MSNTLNAFTDCLSRSHSVYEWNDVIVVHPRGLPPSMTNTNVTTEVEQAAIKSAAIIYKQNLPITDEHVLAIYKQYYRGSCKPTIHSNMVLWLNPSDLSLKNALHIY